MHIWWTICSNFTIFSVHANIPSPYGALALGMCIRPNQGLRAGQGLPRRKGKGTKRLMALLGLRLAALQYVMYGFVDDVTFVHDVSKNIQCEKVVYLNWFTRAQHQTGISAWCRWYYLVKIWDGRVWCGRTHCRWFVAVCRWDRVCLTTLLLMRLLTVMTILVMMLAVTAGLALSLSLLPSGQLHLLLMSVSTKLIVLSIRNFWLVRLIMPP